MMISQKNLNTGIHKGYNPTDVHKCPKLERWHRRLQFRSSPGYIVRLSQNRTKWKSKVEVKCSSST